MVSMVACAQQCRYQSDGYCTLPAAARVTNDAECIHKALPQKYDDKAKKILTKTEDYR